MMVLTIVNKRLKILFISFRYLGRACWGVKWGNTRAFSSPVCDCASRSTVSATKYHKSFYEI